MTKQQAIKAVEQITGLKAHILKDVIHFDKYTGYSDITSVNEMYIRIRLKDGAIYFNSVWFAHLNTMNKLYKALSLIVELTANNKKTMEKIEFNKKEIYEIDLDTMLFKEGE